ncbi:MAG TPA: phosphoribosyltransferase [Chloroflexi bacterium]|nr:phosphoribosyltransferase [Chloroflexota bacterium]
MFDDRKDAGQQLGQALERYRGQRLLVLAIPRGGAEVGYRVARYLDADFSLLIARKLPFPTNPESGFGAIAEDGSTFIYPTAAARVPRESIEEIINYQKEEIERRIEVLRDGEPLPDLADRTVILVDDGIAMGSTMRASIQLCKNQKAGHVVVAVPVAGERAIRDIKPLVDDVVVLESPSYFRAVAQVYRHWRDVHDREVLEIMERI